MPKHKHKSHQKMNQSAAALRANGVKSFQSGNYNQAIAAWERIPGSLRPTAALAEAHFRRGLAQLYGAQQDPQSGVTDLRRAVQYRPDDACYRYHLGLAVHQAGELTAAIQAYQEVRQAGGAFSQRAAYPLALARLQQGKNPSDDPAWAELSPDERAMLQSAQLFLSRSAFRRSPHQLSPDAPRLWQALAALEAGDLDAARTGLQEALIREQTPQAKGLTHYYLGVLAARNENWDEARKEWNAAYTAGLRTPRLQANLVELYDRLAEKLLVEGDAQTALEALREAARHRSDDGDLHALLAHVHQQLGFQAASANRWDHAQQHWRTAAGLDRSSFRLAYNLALAYERNGDYIAAADTWREALRRRPRRADNPDALTDEQVARLWQHAAECYHKGGNHEEAARVYQQAIKWKPDRLDLRLALAEGLLNDGRLTAARNELERILARDPKHVPAMLRLGEIFFTDAERRWGKSQAKQYWDKALSLEPDNPQVRQVMAEWHLDQAEIDYYWDRYAEAIQEYQKALEFQPSNPKTLAYIAACYLELEDEARGHEYTEKALAQATNFDAYAVIIETWLRLHRDQQAWEVLSQAETRLVRVPTEFYVAMASDLLTAGRKEPALCWLQRAVEKNASGGTVLLMIGEMLMDVDIPLSREYLQKAIDAGQMPGQAYLMLSILDERQGNARASKKNLAEAERIALRTQDQELRERVEVARLMAGGPQAFIERLMNIGGPEMVEGFLEDLLDGEFDDE